MPATGFPTARLLAPALLGWLAGVALQLQQVRLWPWTGYALLLLLAVLLLAGLR